MRKTCSVVLYVTSGFSFYMVCLLAFFNEPPLSVRIEVLGVFAAFAVGLLLLGLWASGFLNWKRDIGVVLLSASLSTAFVALTFACMAVTPEVGQMFPKNKLALFSDYATGCSCIAILALVGGLLVWFPLGRATTRDITRR